MSEKAGDTSTAKRAQTGEAVGIERGIERLESRRDSKEEKRVAGQLKGHRARGWMEKLLVRTLSGVVYVLIILGCLYAGVIPTAALMAVMGWVCCSEFFRITRMAGRMPNEVCGLSAALAFPLVAALLGGQWAVAVMAVLLMWAGTWFVFSPRVNVADVAITVFGPIYTAFTLASLVLIRKSNPGLDGALLALVVIGSIWAEDSLAYLVGSTLGRHKMAPRTSPNKSWEGFAGGLAGSVVVWSIGAAFRLCGLTWPLALACGLIEGIVAVMGDLFESRIKRGVGVKDSGNLLPGHGGLLDRTDSLIFGGTIAFYLLLFGGIL